MLKIRLTLAAACMLGITNMSSSFVAKAADADMPGPGQTRIATARPDCQEVWRCEPAGCNWHRVCTRPCPDGLSCYPLYGAYGPYGGIAYWGSYTDGGWGYRR